MTDIMMTPILELVLELTGTGNWRHIVVNHYWAETYRKMFQNTNTMYKSIAASISRCDLAFFDMTEQDFKPFCLAIGAWSPVETLPWVKSKMNQHHQWIFKGAAQAGRLDMLEALRVQGFPLIVDSDDKYSFTVLQWLVDVAGIKIQDYDSSVFELLDNFEAIKWCMKKGFVITDTEFTSGANASDDVIQYLISIGCVYDQNDVADWAALTGSLEHLSWLKQNNHGAWDAVNMTNYLRSAGIAASIPKASWLRAQGAQWPASTFFLDNVNYSSFWLDNDIDKDIAFLGWALSDGFDWADWDCTFLEYMPDGEQKQQLSQRVHALGCPCTC